MSSQNLKAIKIQFLIVSLLPLLSLALPFVKLPAALTVLPGIKASGFTGLDLIKGMLNINSVLESELFSYIGGSELKESAGVLIAVIVMFYVIPLLLFILSAILCALSLNKNYLSRGLAVPPFFAVILSGGVLAFCNWLISSAVNSALGVSVNGSSLTADISSADVAAAASGSLKFSGGIGFWLFILAGLVLGIEAIALGGKKRAVEGDFTQDAIYRENPMNQPNNYPGRTPNGRKPNRDRPTMTWTTHQDVFNNPVYGDRPNVGEQDAWNAGNPTEVSKGRSGMLLGVRGEYQGAQIKMQGGEKIYIGRSSGCNLILSNAKASRKHCKISYDAVEDKYLLTNYSGNGTYLKTGKRLEEGKVYRIPHGTQFRVTKEDEFRVL